MALTDENGGGIPATMLVGPTSYGGYSRGGGAEELADAVRGMMDDLPPEAQREASKFVQKLEQM